MSSFDNKFNIFSTSNQSNDSRNDSKPNVSTSKQSNTLAKIAFSIYGSSTNTQSNMSVASSASPGRSGVKSFTPISSSYSSGKSNLTIPELNQYRYKSTDEMASITLLNDMTSNNVVLAGKNSLQILNMKENSIQEDLLHGCYSIKNKKVMGSILDVAAGYQPFSAYVAVSTTTGSILVFHQSGASKTDKLMYKYSDHTRSVNSISFSPIDPSLLISGSQDGSMKLWDIRSNANKPVVTMYGNSDAVRSLKFSPFHGKKFAAIFDSGVIQKWDIRNQLQYERKLNAHTGPGLSIDWHPEYEYVVTGGRDKQVQIWNLSSTDARQIPDHVIYTSSAVSKVAFRPTQTNSINSAEVAASFLNNDFGVQIYSLRRKYIPMYNIESHSSQITGLTFLNNRYLLTCSKDHYFISDDISSYAPVISNLPLCSTTWTPNGDLCYTNQCIQNVAIEEQYEQNLQQPSHTAASSFSTSPTGNTAVMMNSSPSISSVTDNTSPRPGISRASSQFIRPPLLRNHSPTIAPTYNRNSSLTTHQLNNESVLNPVIVPVDLPITRNLDVLQYLIDNYRFNPSNDLIETCFFNSEIAKSVGNLRDSQTWKVISESLTWESKLEQELIYKEKKEVFPTANVDTDSLRSNDMNDSQTDSDKYIYSTSNSTTYGKSPSFSDMSELGSSLRNHSFSSSYRMSSLKQSILKDHKDHLPSTQDLILEENEELDNNKTITKDDILKWNVDPSKAPNSSETLKATADDATEEAIEFTESESIPILKPRSKRASMKLITGSASPTGARSISPSFSISSSMSNASQAFFNKAKQLPLGKSFIPLPSTLSELTRQLTNHEKIDEVIESDIPTVLLPPFTPRFIIEKVINWNLEQGDLIMSSILIILFNSKYKIYPKNSNVLKEVIHGYLEWLQRMKYFIKFSEINQVLVNEGIELELSKVSTTASGIRHFCSNCGKLIVNEAAKAKLQESLNNKENEEKMNKYVGSWFCELCSAWNRCVYCNEVVKGLTLIKLNCGHNGHFGCLQSWFLDEGFNECPAGCL